MRNLYAILLIQILISCKSNSTLPNNTVDEIASDPVIIELNTLQTQLSKEVDETSGLVRIGDQFWTHNDSGGKAAIYQIDPQSGEVLKTVTIENAQNRDWEDLAADEQHLYIGDFGNNRGGRKDLVIYKIALADLIKSTTATAEVISFSYTDQDKYYNSYQHNHDCEAMIAKGDKLYLFSKNWLNKKCKLYELPKTAGNYSISPISEFDAQGTITAATLSDKGEELFLLGYIPGQGFDPFIWRISDWGNNQFFAGEMKRIDLKPRRQTEGISLYKDSLLLISAEAEGNGFPTLFTLARSF